jgi:hypothetical protein
MNADVYGYAGMLSFLRRGGGDGSDPDLNGRHPAALDEMDRCGLACRWPISAVCNSAERHVRGQGNMGKLFHVD